MFLLELGQGFAFVGRQVPLEVAGDEFYIDLLFYHLKLRCYVVIELKPSLPSIEDIDARQKDGSIKRKKIGYPKSDV